MASSDKRPSVKGRKRAQGRFSDQEEAVVAAGDAATTGDIASPLSRNEALLASAPSSSDAGCEKKASSTRIGSKLLGRMSSMRKGKDESFVDDMSDKAADDAPPSAPVRSVDVPRREEPADFFDLGDFGDDAPSAKKGPRRHAEAKAFRRGADRSQVENVSTQPPAGLPPALVTDAAPGFPESRRSTSRKATEREKAIVRGRKRKVAWAVAASIFLIAAVVSGLLFWNAYLRYDDAADMRGEWQVADGSMTVVIDGSSIKMPDALEYAYELDTWEKTISFSFDDLSGTGAYRFSSDRKGLVIEEGEGGKDGVVALIKVSDDEAAEPHRGPAESAVDGQEQDEGESPDVASTEGGASDGTA